MVRGKFILIGENKTFFCSTEFNGGMYPACLGEEIIAKLASGEIQTKKDFEEYVADFNKKHFTYKDSRLIFEVTEENCQKCGANWHCSECTERRSCQLEYSFEGANLFDIRTYNYHSDYMYWLNISGEDIEVATKNGIVSINDGGGAVFHFRDFLPSILDSGLINPDDSLDFSYDAKIIKIMNKFSLLESEAQEWLDYHSSSCNIVCVYGDEVELENDQLYNHADIPEYLKPFFNFAAFGSALCENDGYYQLSSGKIKLRNQLRI